MGGGTGGFVVLSGLKKLPIELSAIVTMMDSGGSTGRLRDQLGVLPPGDLRQCLVALSEAPDLWRKLFLYRFETGDFEGHNFGNIFLSALEKVTSNYHEVLETVSYVLKTKGHVIPVTFDKTHLCVEYENGVVLKGESHIDEGNKETGKIKHAFLDPQVSANGDALSAIENSEAIIIGPGDLYTSIIPILLVPGIKSHLQSSKGKLVYIMNLMTKLGQTSQYGAMDHIRDLETYMGKPIDVVIMNNGKISPEIIKWYTSHNERPVINDINPQVFKGKVIEEDVLTETAALKNKADKLTRSILRHDSDKLARVISRILSL